MICSCQICLSNPINIGSDWLTFVYSFNEYIHSLSLLLYLESTLYNKTLLPQKRSRITNHGLLQASRGARIHWVERKSTHQYHSLLLWCSSSSSLVVSLGSRIRSFDLMSDASLCTLLFSLFISALSSVISGSVANPSSTLETSSSADSPAAAYLKSLLGYDIKVPGFPAV